MREQCGDRRVVDSGREHVAKRVAYATDVVPRVCELCCTPVKLSSRSGRDSRCTE
jgi:hypothetical protein